MPSVRPDHDEIHLEILGALSNFQRRPAYFDVNVGYFDVDRSRQVLELRARRDFRFMLERNVTL